MTILKIQHQIHITLKRDQAEAFSTLERPIAQDQGRERARSGAASSLGNQEPNGQRTKITDHLTNSEWLVANDMQLNGNGDA
jgi:hypothetical protein